MKRPGDEPSPSLQPANKLQKSVTFSLPISRVHTRERSPAASSISSLNSSPPNCGSTHLPNLGSNSMTWNQQQMPPPPPQRSHSQGDTGSHNSSSMGNNGNHHRQRSILRSTTSGSGPSNPRFTFDFVDDASLGPDQTS